MTVQLYYTVVRHIPDPARAEALNIGLIVSGPDGFLSVRILPDAGRIKKLDPAFDERKLTGMKNEWPIWMAREQTSQPNPQQFLVDLRHLIGGYQTQLTEPRLIELDGEPTNTYPFEHVSLDLFDRLVKPPAALPKKPRTPRTSIKKQLKSQFTQRKLLGQVVHLERWVQGRLPYPVAFLYENGRRIAIDTVEPADGIYDAPHIGQAAAATFGKWTDVRELGQEPNTMFVSVLPSGNDDAMRSARAMLSEHSTVYQYPDDWAQLLEEIGKGLTPEQRLAAGLGSNGHSHK